jgi:hypothetical protein
MQFLSSPLIPTVPSLPVTGAAGSLLYHGTSFYGWNGTSWKALDNGATSISDVSGLQAALDAKLDDSQAGTFGLSLLGTATAASATALLSTFTNSTKGLVPASGGGSTYFLRADGAWAPPPASGEGGGGSSWTVTTTGTGEEQIIILPEDTTEEQIIMFVEGVHQHDGYSILGSVLTTTQPDGFDIRIVRYGIGQKGDPGAGAAWGNIGGVIMDQLDLQAALDGKANTLHDHDADYAASDHSHSNVEAGGSSGFMTGSDKTKLDGIATGATVNSSDAQLRDRSTHTGTQAQSTITNLTTDLAAKANDADVVKLTGTQTIGGVKTFSSTISGSISGNAGTATVLQTARAINGTNFDGSGAITITANTPSILTFNNGGTGAASGTTFNGGSAITISHNTLGAAALSGATFTGKVITPATVAANAGFCAPHGTAPSTPVNGDLWSTTTALSFRLNGATKVVAFTDSNITGSAATLTTSRNFAITGGGITAAAVGFNGSANVTLSASVDAGHVTLARMANLAANSIIGNNTGGAVTPIALTSTQVTAMLNEATVSLKGLMSSTDKTKLDGIAAGATVNSSDAQLRDRATHTGTQAQSTITNLTTDLAAKANTTDVVLLTGNQTVAGTKTFSGTVAVSGTLTQSGKRVLTNRDHMSTAVDSHTGEQLYFRELSNTFYNYQNRFDVVNVGGLAAGQTLVRTITIPLTERGVNGLVYVDGAFFFGFYSAQLPESISLRFYNQVTEAWSAPYVTTQNLSGNTFGWYRIDVGGNYLSAVEITVVAPSGNSANWTHLEFHPNREFVGFNFPRPYVEQGGSAVFFGGSKAAHLSLRNTGTTLRVRNGDDTADASISVANVTASGAITGSNLSGTNTGDQTTITGNAGSATVLQTARNFSISGGGITAATQSFNGSANVVLSASVDSGHITLARMSNLPANSIIGNNTGSAATPLALTGTQVTAMLSAFGAAAQGVVPASGGGTANFLRADGTWASPSAATPQKFSIGLSVLGKPSNGQRVLPRFDVPFDITLSASSSRASSDEPAAASTVFIIRKNGTQIGTVTWASNATVATVAFTDTSVVAGDIIRVEAPATADATLADIGITLAGVYV